MAKTLSTSFTLSDAAMRSALGEIQASLVDRVLTSAGLAIGTSSKAKVKIVNDTYCYVDGVIVKVAAATEVALSGTVTADKFNVYVLTVNSSGTVTATMGTEGADLAHIVMPAVPTDQAMIGFVIINPTGTGNFVGGTTELDDATVVPNAVYVNANMGFNPNVLAM